MKVFIYCFLGATQSFLLGTIGAVLRVAYCLALGSTSVLNNYSERWSVVVQLAAKHISRTHRMNLLIFTVIFLEDLATVFRKTVRIVHSEGPDRVRYENL